jgi:hypothetical protein
MVSHMVRRRAARTHPAPPVPRVEARDEVRDQFQRELDALREELLSGGPLDPDHVQCVACGKVVSVGIIGTSGPRPRVHPPCAGHVRAGTRIWVD